jgi:Tfp pilus assembly protein PilE
MGDINYRVIFKGEIAPDADLNEVKTKIASITKADSKKIETLFSGGNVIIKKNATLETCEKVRDTFKKAGAVSYIEEEKASDTNNCNASQQKEPTPPPLPSNYEADGNQDDSGHRDKRADEIFCSACGEVIQIKALQCPYCGKKHKKEGMSGWLIAIIIIVMFFFIGGILAAIAIPQFAAYRNKSYQAMVKSELKNLYMAEEAYYKANNDYTDNLTELNFQAANSMVTIEITSADEDCFEAKGGTANLKKTYLIDCNGEISEE